jgi:glucose-6-phosphate isomerase
MSNDLPFEVSLSLALEGVGAPERTNYAAARSAAEGHLSNLIHDTKPLELLTIVNRSDDLEEISKFTGALTSGASTVFVLGIGGSSLGGQTLSELSPLSGMHAPQVKFFDGPGAGAFNSALETCDLETTRFLAISKSGSTPETLAQTLLAAAALRDGLGADKLAKCLGVITERKASALRNFAEGMGCPILDHPDEIGGRYSVLSAVGLAPAVMMGLDANAIRAGAKSVIRNARAHPNAWESPAAGAALHFALLQEGKLCESVLWSYADRLGLFGDWWRQLWAESLGKDGQGTMPIAAIGPIDQHSQLQLFLGGPGKALFTLISSKTSTLGPKIPVRDAEKLGLSYLGGKSLGDLFAAEAKATAHTLARGGQPVRLISLGKVDEYGLGALFMHFMLETILMGRLTGVDPFDQPAVEEGKILARKFLQGE